MNSRNARPEPDDAMEMACKLLMDPGSLYAKVMTACSAFWLTGSLPKAQNGATSADTERIFRMMWLGYEQWLGRGFHHYVQVAIELDRFYKRLRWDLIINKKKASDLGELDRRIAGSAHAYLSSVRELAEDGFERFQREIETVLQELQSLEKKETEGTRPASPTTGN